MRKVVFAGGTHAGKTTMVERFAAYGYTTAPEAGYDVIKEYRDARGVEFWSWRAENQTAFYELIARRQIELESRLPDSEGIAFLDRGIVDLIGFCRYVGCEIPAIIPEYAATHRYDAVFIFDTLAAPDPREVEGRTFNREDSKKIRELVDTAYRELNYVPQYLADMPVDVREARVREYIATLLP